MSKALETLGRTVKRLQYKHQRLLDSRLGKIGSSLAQWDTLRAIGEHPNSSSHKLATLTFQTDQSFGGLANRLVDRGLIRRVPGVGRALHHELTPEGEAMWQAGRLAAREALAESFAPLSGEQRRQLQSLLEKLLEDDASGA